MIYDTKNFRGRKLFQHGNRNWTVVRGNRCLAYRLQRKSDAPLYNTRETDVDDCVSSCASLVSALERVKRNWKEPPSESGNDLKMHRSGGTREIAYSIKYIFASFVPLIYRLFSIYSSRSFKLKFQHYINIFFRTFNILSSLTNRFLWNIKVENCMEYT